MASLKTSYGKMGFGGSEPTGTLPITANGNYNVKDYATADVNVPASSSTLIEKSITANGTYNAFDDEADGYSKVVVDTPSANVPYIEETYDASNRLICVAFYGHTNIRANAYQSVKTLVSVETVDVKGLNNYCFDGCTALTDVEFCEGMTSAGQYTFQNCTSLKRIELPSTLLAIGGGLLRGCSNLEEVIIKSNNISTFKTDAFQDCIKLLDIYVPWQEGEVRGAPWGALNATIHYGYVPTV